MDYRLWMCSFCRENDKTDLHPNLQFILETTNDKKSLPFLDLSINVKSEGTIFCTWYQKTSDTGTILDYRSCTPLQHKKSIIKGTIHRLFRATSNWEAFHEALTENEEIWERNQYPRHWVENIVKDTIKQLQMKEQRKEHNVGVALKQQKNTEKQQFVLQYVKSIYVGQTCRHITTRVAEHAKADSPMGVHAIECNGDKTAFQWKILDQCGNQSKLITLEELYLITLKPAIKTEHEN